MPHLDARAIEVDPEGMDLLRRVVASAAGGALAYDPHAFATDGDRRAVAPPLPAARLARGLFSQIRKPSLKESAGLVWA